MINYVQLDTITIVVPALALVDPLGRGSVHCLVDQSLRQKLCLCVFLQVEKRDYVDVLPVEVVGKLMYLILIAINYRFKI